MQIHPDALSAVPPAVLPEVADDVLCILEPVCLEEFLFSPCPHPDIRCLRHRYERLAEGEGERAYGAAAWKTMKSVNPIAIVQMIEEIRGRDSSLTP